MINDVLNRNKKPKLNSISLIDDDNTVRDSLESANLFNEYFSNIGSNLASHIQDIEDLSASNFFHDRQNSSIEMQLTNEREIVELVAGLSDASGGPDEIPAKIMKQVIKDIIKPITHICNISITTGVFPQNLKLSKITPIHKQGSKQNIGNYRPISILNCFSKILEKLILNRFEDFFIYHNTLIPNQHGFTRSKSTTSAILQLTDYVLKQFDSRKYVIGIFLDFKKAFDTIDHEILLKKMENYGIRGTALKWISSYLSNRQCFTRINNQTSQKCILTHSIPQGSILGPLLFNIYINDLINSTSKLGLILFADDSCFYSSNHNLEQLITEANFELNNINKWTMANNMSLNFDKSHFMIFNRHKR